MESRDPLPGTEGKQWMCLAAGRYLISEDRQVLDVVEGQKRKPLAQECYVMCKARLFVRQCGGRTEPFEQYDFAKERWSLILDEKSSALWRIDRSYARPETSPDSKYDAVVHVRDRQTIDWSIRRCDSTGALISADWSDSV